MVGIFADIRCDAGQANQHGAVVEIVFGDVVNVGSGCQQFGTIIKVNTNHKRTRLSRAMRRHARQQFSANLECGRPVRSALLHAGQRQAIRTMSKLSVLLGMGGAIIRKKSPKQLQFGVLRFGFRSDLRFKCRLPSRSPKCRTLDP